MHPSCFWKLQVHFLTKQNSYIGTDTQVYAPYRSIMEDSAFLLLFQLSLEKCNCGRINVCIHFWNSSYHCTILILNLCKLHSVITLVSPATTSHKKVLTKWMWILYNRPNSFCLSTPCNQCNVPFLLDLVNQWWVLLPWFDFHNFSSFCLAMIDCWPQTNSLRLIAHSIFSFVFIIYFATFPLMKGIIQRRYMKKYHYN